MNHNYDLSTQPYSMLTLRKNGVLIRSHKSAVPLSQTTSERLLFCCMIDVKTLDIFLEGVALGVEYIIHDFFSSSFFKLGRSGQNDILISVFFVTIFMYFYFV